MAAGGAGAWASGFALEPPLGLALRHGRFMPDPRTPAQDDSSRHQQGATDPHRPSAYPTQVGPGDEKPGRRHVLLGAVLLVRRQPLPNGRALSRAVSEPRPSMEYRHGPAGYQKGTKARVLCWPGHGLPQNRGKNRD